APREAIQSAAETFCARQGLTGNHHVTAGFPDTPNAGDPPAETRRNYVREVLRPGQVRAGMVTHPNYPACGVAFHQPRRDNSAPAERPGFYSQIQSEDSGTSG